MRPGGRSRATLTRKVQIPHTEARAFDVHGQVDLASSRQVLDVAVAAVLWATRDGASTFARNLLLDVACGRASSNVLRIGRLGNDATAAVHGSDELTLALIPFSQNFRRGRAAQDSGVNQAGKLDAWDVSR